MNGKFKFSIQRSNNPLVTNQFQFLYGYPNQFDATNNLEFMLPNEVTHQDLNKTITSTT